MRATPLILAIVLAATAAAAQPSVDRGRWLAQHSCAMCHAVGERGASHNRAAPPFRELYKRYPIDNLAEAFAEGIVTGHPQMPEFRLSAGQTADLLAYLKSLQRRQHAASGSPGDGN
jgi:mono/diheme cytochrome c family protein